MSRPTKPAARAAKPSTALAPYDAFRNEIVSREEELVSILPPHIKPEKFRNTALIAVKNDPALLAADRRSLHKAITQAAEDGLHPDGREGTITVYSEKQKDGSYIKRAQWSPMIGGLRKRAMELAGMIIDAQVVYENDHFIWGQGDEPRIEHQPATLGTDRGPPIGAYAIFKARDGAILHREVMSKAEIDAVKSCSRAASTSLLWTKFWTEGWRKTVIRRGIKTVPCLPELERLIGRDDETFDLSPPLTVVPSAPPVEAHHGASPSRAPSGAVIDLTASQSEAAADEEGAADASADSAAGGSVLDEFHVALAACRSLSILSKVWDKFEPRMGDARDACAEAYEVRVIELEE